jgi:uncharacterized protein (TIGR03437 family)
VTASAAPKANQAQSAWLAVNTNATASFGTLATPVTAAVSANPAGLADGSYSGTVTFTTASPGVAPVNVPVALNVNSTLPTFSSYGVANAGSYQASVVAPGEAVVIFGNQFGPAALAGLSLTNGKVDTLIGGTRVLFDGVPAPMIYALTGQVSCFVPFGVAGKITTQVQVEYNGVRSPPVTVGVLNAAPGLLTLDSSGGGQGAIRNQDQSINSSSNPAAPGDYVTLYGVGAGQTNPPGQDGALYTTAPIPTLVTPLTVNLDGKDLADVAYAGPAGGAIHGVWQVNIRLPMDISHGNVPAFVKSGAARTQPGVTVAVK